LNVAAILARMGCTEEEQFYGLMHDTPEAYLADIAAPFKREIGVYYDKEALVWRRIAAKYSIPEKLPDCIKVADWLALFIEARHMVADDEEMRSWVGYDQYGEESKKHDFKPFMMPPVAARQAFIDCFVQLRRV